MIKETCIFCGQVIPKSTFAKPDMDMEEVLTCVEACTRAEECNSDNYACCYGDTSLFDCVDRLEEDYCKILNAVKKIRSYNALCELAELKEESK